MLGDGKYCGCRVWGWTGDRSHRVLGRDRLGPGARDCFLSRLSIVTNEVVFDALQFVIDINIIVITSPAPRPDSTVSLTIHVFSSPEHPCYLLRHMRGGGGAGAQWTSLCNPE